ncbi:MAG TPA: hypothetical protein VFB12_27210 [Ktedonobacteraceae bacterium]|nr:hypothetical protein [Ktedonobacteraceae bacterium]
MSAPDRLLAIDSLRSGGTERGKATHRDNRKELSLRAVVGPDLRRRPTAPTR